MTATSSTPDVVLEYQEGDRLPQVLVVVENEDASPFTYELRMRKSTNGALITKTGIPSFDGTDTTIVFSWAAGDLVAGTHSAVIKLIDDELREETLVSRMVIEVGAAI